MPRHIALLTDFGLVDPYVGQMKGALLRHAPDAVLVDISHQVRPCDILQAGFFLAASHASFPRDTIFVAVVDPGVGSDRRIVLAEWGERCVLAPDNGLLTQLLLGVDNVVTRDVTPASIGNAAGGAVHGGHFPAAGGSAASATFHGRDVFAPLAARLANGEAPSVLGPCIAPGSLVRLAAAQPVLDGVRLTATVLHVDRFGNCLLNLNVRIWGGRLAACQGLALAKTAALLGSFVNSAQWSREIPGQPEGKTAPPNEPPSVGSPLRSVATYAQLAPGELGLLAGSQGCMELAMNQASAAAALNVSPGDKVGIVMAGQA